MNVALGVLTLIGCIAVGIGVVQELAAKRKKAVHVDREVSDLVASFRDGHVFHTPELGLTMADGGENVNKKEQR